MSNARNHHFIPQFYLRNFTKSGGAKSNLFVYDKTRSKTFKTSPRNVCAQRDFNRISIDGYENYIEQELSKIEGELSKIFTSLISKKSYPAPEELNYIVNFINITAIRNPKMRSLYDNFDRQIFEKIASTIVSDEDIFEQTIKNTYRDDSTKAPSVTYEEVKFY